MFHRLDYGERGANKLQRLPCVTPADKDPKMCKYTENVPTLKEGCIAPKKEQPGDRIMG